jgi:hypothetical protein
MAFLVGNNKGGGYAVARIYIFLEVCAIINRSPLGDGIKCESTPNYFTAAKSARVKVPQRYMYVCLIWHAIPLIDSSTKQFTWRHHRSAYLWLVC